MGRFSEVAKADASGRGNYFPNLPVTYRVKLSSCKMIDTRAGKSAFIIDCEVLEVKIKPGDKTEDADHRTLPAAGETRNQYVSLSNDAGPADVQRFLLTAASIMGEDYDLKTDKGVKEFDKFAELCVDEKDPALAGVEFRLVTYNRDTRAGKPFTIHEWSPIPASWLPKE
jgi:hypothetical protein